MFLGLFPTTELVLMLPNDRDVYNLQRLLAEQRMRRRAPLFKLRRLILSGEMLRLGDCL